MSRRRQNYVSGNRVVAAEVQPLLEPAVMSQNLVYSLSHSKLTIKTKTFCPLSFHPPKIYSAPAAVAKFAPTLVNPKNGLQVSRYKVGVSFCPMKAFILVVTNWLGPRVRHCLQSFVSDL